MKWVLILIFILLFVIPSYGRVIGYTEDPLKVGIGARAMGMGGTFAAVDEECGSLFNNPASLAKQKDLYFTSMYASLMGDVNYLVAGLSRSIKLGRLSGVVGLGHVGSSVGQIISPSQTGLSYFDYYNNTWVLCYAGETWKEGLDMGLNLKLFDKGFTGSVNYLGSGMDLDLGFLFPIQDKTKIGFVLQNILPYSWGGKITWPNGDIEEVPMVARAGIASQGLRENLLLAFDYQMDFQRNYPGRYHLGIEWAILKSLKLRAGIDEAINAGLVTSNLTLGLGLRLRAITVDYAYHPYFGESGSLTHYVSISFGPPLPVKEESKQPEVKTDFLKLPSEVVEKEKPKNLLGTREISKLDKKGRFKTSPSPGFIEVGTVYGRRWYKPYSELPEELKPFLMILKGTEEAD